MTGEIPAPTCTTWQNVKFGACIAAAVLFVAFLIYGMVWNWQTEASERRARNGVSTQTTRSAFCVETDDHEFVSYSDPVSRRYLRECGTK